MRQTYSKPKECRFLGYCVYFFISQNDGI